MATLQYVDGMLVTWGDRLFNDSVSSRKGATKGLLREPKRRGGQGGKLKADEVRQKLRDTLNKVPEVTVKITSSGKSIKQIKDHLDYISRNGEKELEDQDGKLIDGREAVRDLRDAWRNGPNAVPFETSNVRESFVNGGTKWSHVAG